MKVSFALITGFVAATLAQTYPECTAELVRTDDCAGVIDANACYNKFGFRNAQTLQCIEGKDDAEKKKRVRIIQPLDWLSLTMCVGLQMLQLCWQGHVRLGYQTEVCLLESRIIHDRAFEVRGIVEAKTRFSAR